MESSCAAFSNPPFHFAGSGPIASDDPHSRAIQGNSLRRPLRHGMENDGRGAGEAFSPSRPASRRLARESCTSRASHGPRRAREGVGVAWALF